ncbi:MAG: hypothetical protein EZS28_021154, partial [Streblomastix strix]
MNHQKAETDKLRVWSSKMIMDKTTIPDLNWWIMNLKSNVPAHLARTISEMIMTADASHNRWDSTPEMGKEMKSIAHGTCKRIQTKQKFNSKEIKAIIQGFASITKFLKNSQTKSLAIINDNSTAVFDIKKWRTSTTLIEQIKEEIIAERASKIQGAPSASETLSVWEGVCSFLDNYMIQGKGVVLPDFATFSFQVPKIDAGNQGSFNKRIP